jgi:hypothetical protein
MKLVISLRPESDFGGSCLEREHNINAYRHRCSRFEIIKLKWYCYLKKDKPQVIGTKKLKILDCPRKCEGDKA